MTRGVPGWGLVAVTTAVLVILCGTVGADDAEQEGSATLDDREPRPVAQLDLDRYAGLWYEIARLPNGHQKKCAGDVTAYYTPLEDDRLEVVNSCARDDGRRVAAAGIAKVADKDGPPSKLKVRFAPGILSWIPWVWADYWVLDVDPDYRHSLVGTPDHDNLWMLARTPHIDQATFERLVETARDQGFDVDELVLTPQASDRWPAQEDPGGDGPQGERAE